MLYESPRPRQSERIKRTYIAAFRYPGGKPMQRGDEVSVGGEKYRIIGWRGDTGVMVIRPGEGPRVADVEEVEPWS